MQCSGAASESGLFQSKVLKHRHEQVGQRLVMITPEDNMLTVPKAAAGK